MDIFPAIDILGGKAVRLVKGDYSRATVYSGDPLQVAADFKQCGAAFVHLVDLDGARDGTAVNMPLISRLVLESGLKAEAGGGIRTEETVERYLDAGVWRVILGTAAAEDPAFLERMCRRFGDRIAVGIDADSGRVKLRGWLQESGRTIEDMCRMLTGLGVTGTIVTDISRDGAMRGPNTALYASLRAQFPSLRITASGGVSSHEDLAALKGTGVSAAIVGKAYYTGAVDLKRAVEESR